MRLYSKPKHTLSKPEQQYIVDHEVTSQRQEEALEQGKRNDSIMQDLLE